MDQVRVTRNTLPQVTVGMPLWLLTWVDEQAQRAGLSRSAWIVKLIQGTRDDMVNDEIGRRLTDATVEETEAVPA